MIDAALQWMGGQFGPEDYLFWTRLQCLAWTGADVVIVYGLLRIGDLARGVCRLRPHRVSYLALVLTLLFVPAVAVAPSGRMIFAIELIVTVPHFLIILYVLAADARPMAAALDRRVRH